MKIEKPRKRTNTGEVSSSAIRILHIEDSISDRFVIERHLKKNDFAAAIVAIESRDELLGALEEEWDVILCDHKMPGFSSREALEILSQTDADIPFLVVSGAIGEFGVLEALRNGAHDYIAKDDLLRLTPAMRREMREAQVRRAKALADEKLRSTNERLREAVEKLSTTQSHLARIERLRALGQIASGVAHDFNNSLSKIMGISEILESRFPSETELLDDLREVARDSTKVVQRLRGFYVGRPVTEGLKPVNVEELLRRSVELTRPKWHSIRDSSFKKIECRFLPSDVPPVAADESELREVLTNLIFNAVDAMGESDSGRIELSAERQEDCVEISVKDNGCGMPEEVLERCREPFYTTKGDNGTGLGLGLADTVLRRFGGSLAIESEPGIGTTIRLRLPIFLEEKDLAADGDGAAETIANPSSRSLRVLLVEDDPMLLGLMRKLLEIDGHQVVAACADADSALECFSESRFDLAITDFNLPGMDGTEFSRRIKEFDPRIPVVMSTGHFEVEDDDWPDTVDRILPKPVSRDELRKVVAEVVLPS